MPADSMHETFWFLIVGSIFVAVGIASSLFARLPCSTAMCYLAAGVVLGPPGAGLLSLSVAGDSGLLRILTEIALMVSLFAIGLRLRLPVLDPLWSLPLRLGFLAMAITVPLTTLFGVYVLHLGWGQALLLAAILSPTDPVLAHDVQVRHSSDLDRLRFALSGEGGLNLAPNCGRGIARRIPGDICAATPDELVRDSRDRLVLLPCVRA